MTDRAATCAACRITRPMDSMIQATMRATGRTRYVCRPSMSEKVPDRGPCFGILRPAAEETIALASDVPRGTERRQRVGDLLVATVLAGSRS